MSRSSEHKTSTTSTPSHKRCRPYNRYALLSSVTPLMPPARMIIATIIVLVLTLLPSCVSSFVTPNRKHLDHAFSAVTHTSKRSLAPAPSVSSSALDMFTGIIEEMGEVVSLEEREDVELWDGNVGAGTVLTVKGDVALQGAYLGCSIAVSGVCLTATAIDTEKQQFTVGLAPETLRRTYFGDLKAGDAVNLERASEIGGRNSGHFVQGHVDGTGTVVERTMDQDSLVYKIQVDPSLMPYIVPKGFIAIDGTSLTVVDADLTTCTFSFMLIEYTQKKIVVTQKMKGDRVNIEVDVLAKYSEAALAPVLPRIAELEHKVQQLEAELAKLNSR